MPPYFSERQHASFLTSQPIQSSQQKVEDLNLPLPDLTASTAYDLGISAWFKQVEAHLHDALEQGASIRDVVHARVQAADSVIIALFELFELHKTSLALFATGGYGRGELSRHSDLDIMLLSPSPMDDKTKDKVNRFVAQIWDIAVEPGLAVRTIDECHDVIEDITVATALLETRMLAGNEALRKLPTELVYRHWSQFDFYNAKMEETKRRYLHHNSTEYNLEPDIKNAPGGLRDIHTIGWVCKRYFRVNRFYDLVSQDFLTEQEYDSLVYAEDFLWRIRHYLHQLTGRDTNKLLFDYQHRIAVDMGYKADKENPNPNAAVEQFMRDYYRCAMQISTLAEMLTSHYFETIIEARLPQDQRPKHTTLNARFNKVGDHIAISHHQVFSQNPSAILEMFLLMGQHGIKKVRTPTLRALKVAINIIDDDYRNQDEHKQLFIANLKEQNFLFHRLRTMKRYGILGSYIPQFSHVIGLMQYDLFHRYTVDAHILLLVRVLHRFTDPKYQDEYSLVSNIYQRIHRKEILVLAAIFHDIAKGRGGDHSELGEIDAIEFCLQHNLSEADAKLVGWMTRYHLLMSMTAQKKDISDPQVVTDFAKAVGNVTHLNHLYVLTVADMTATNPKLWNSWRAMLLKQLYTHTRRILRADVSAPTNRQEMIDETYNQALQMLDEHDHSNMNREEVLTLWQELGDEYFLREVPEDIIWHTEAILAHPPIGQASNADSEPLIVLREHRDLAIDAVQVFIYTQNQANLFAVTTAVFDQMALNVLDARIITATRDFALDSYVVLDEHGTLLSDLERQEMLSEQLIAAFKQPDAPKLINKRLPRQLKNFTVPTRVTFAYNELSQQHIMTITTLDQPGLLARIGRIFLEHNIEIHAARITTLGERAENMFYITDMHDAILSEDKLAKLEQSLIDILDC